MLDNSWGTFLLLRPATYLTYTMFLNKWTTQLEPTRRFLQKTYCCFIAGLLLIARAVILLESWTRAQDLLENCHFAIIWPFNVSFPSQKKTQIPPEFVTCSPRTLCTSEVNSSSVKYQGQRWKTKHPWRIQLQFVSCSQPKWHLCAKKSKPNQLWVTRAFTRCSQPITFAFEASSDIVVTENGKVFHQTQNELALPTWGFEVSHPSGDCEAVLEKYASCHIEFVETALGDSPSPIQLAVAQDCLQHFAEAPIEDGRNTSFNSVRTTDPFLRIISLDDNCQSYQNFSVNLIKHLVWVLSTLQIHRANHQGHIVQITPEN